VTQTQQKHALYTLKVGVKQYSLTPHPRPRASEVYDDLGC